MPPRVDAKHSEILYNPPKVARNFKTIIKTNGNALNQNDKKKRRKKFNHELYCGGGNQNFYQTQKNFR